MESGRGCSVTVGDAPSVSVAEKNRARVIIETKGHLYTLRNKYQSLRVFSRELMEVSRLCRVYGGSFYTHGVGYIWVTSKKSLISAIMSETKLKGGEDGETENQGVSDSGDC